MKRYFGAHVTSAGGLESAIAAAQDLDINTIQIHPCPPQRWNSRPFAKDAELKFNQARASSCVERVFFHGIYLINLANPDDQKYQLSKLSLVHDLELLSRMKGDGVIFHMGSLKDQPDEMVGLKRVADGINWVMDNSPKDSRLILEVAAGSGKIIGDRLEELATVYSMVEEKERVGFGLDSQHLWASGYDLKNNLDGFIDDLKRILTTEKVWAFHLNDSMTQLASRKDRHANLGEGEIGIEGIERIVNHPEFRDIPFILETPGLKDPETARIEVEKLRGLIK